jgi:hypothetical protein
VDACVRHRALPLNEAVTATVEQISGCVGEDDLLLLAAEVKF